MTSRLDNILLPCIELGIFLNNAYYKVKIGR